MSHVTYQARTLTEAQREIAYAAGKAVFALPDAQVKHGYWHAAGPIDPPDAGTIMTAAGWYALSPDGRARGLNFQPSGVTGYKYSLRGPANAIGWDALEAIVGPEDLTHVLFGKPPIRFVDPLDPQQVLHVEPLGLSDRDQLLDRVAALLKLCSPGRRVLSSR